MTHSALNHWFCVWLLLRAFLLEDSLQKQKLYFLFYVRSGPGAKKVKKGGFKPNEKLTKEELKKNRQQRKKDLKRSRQEAERKDMYEIINQSKHMWGDLRRYMSTHTHSLTGSETRPSFVLLRSVQYWMFVLTGRTARKTWRRNCWESFVIWSMEKSNRFVCLLETAHLDFLYF